MKTHHENPLRSIHRGLAVAAALLLAACGPADKPTPAAQPAAQRATANADQAAPADEVAKQARGDIACPAKTTSPARADGAPVDDVLGVRPGQRYDEAVNGVLCANELLVVTPEARRGFEIKAYGQTLRQGFSARFAEPRVVRTGQQIVQDMQRDATARGLNTVREDLKPGQSKWFVGTMGVPGQEQVLSVAREERFVAEQSPTVDALKAALLKKYGAATHDQDAGGGQMPGLRWAYDPLGRPVAAGSALFHQCRSSADPNHGVNLTPDCGLVVEALLIPQKANPALVDRLQVGVVNKAGGYALITATEQALAQADQQRRATEVDKAAKNAKAPSL